MQPPVNDNPAEKPEEDIDQISLNDSGDPDEQSEPELDTLEMDLSEGSEDGPVIEPDPVVEPARALVNVIDDDEEAAIAENFAEEQIDSEALLVEELIANMHVTMKDPHFKNVPPNTLSGREYLTTLTVGLEDVERLLTKYNIDFEDPKSIQDAPAHVQRLADAVARTAGTFQHKYFDGIFKKGDWGQGLEIGGDNLLRQSLINAKDNVANPVASIMTQLGMGTVIQIPLWHSGIWVAIRKPKETDLLNLEADIAADKTSLGRATEGAVFSNNEVYAKKAIVDFVLDHVVRTTYESSEPARLAEVILETDWPLLAWGILLAEYPSGYRHLQPCVANPETCEHVIDTMLNIGRLLWVDRSRFTPSQIAHMKSRTTTHSREKIKAYQDEHRLNVKSTIQLNKVLELQLRVPTLAESIARGLDWVEDISDMAKKAFTLSKMSEASRERHRTNIATMASIRQYVQWFGSFRRVDRQETYSNEQMVEEILSNINESGEFSTAVHNRIREYINDTTLACIALPKWKCPKCQGEPSEEYLRHPDLVPLDIVDVFFTLLDQKIRKRLVEESVNVM